MADLIDRQAALERLRNLPIKFSEQKQKGIDEAVIEICLMPPAVSEKKGKWVPVTTGRGGNECSLCHDYAPSYQSGVEYLSPYCPNCGAKMKVAWENNEDEIRKISG